MYRQRAVICLTATAAVLAAGLVAPAGAGADRGRGSGERVEIVDDCEAMSFNDAVGPGTCVGDGETTFPDFLDQLAEEGAADDWEFHPSDFRVDAGERVALVNTGGEAHTFTEVEKFGGGCLGFLNEVLGGLQPVPECAGFLLDHPTGPPPKAFVDSVVVAGDTVHIHLWDPGTHKFECLIHPWMRAEVEVRAGDHRGHRH